MMAENIRFRHMRGPKPTDELLSEVANGKRIIFKLITKVGQLFPDEGQETRLKGFIDGFEVLGTLIEDVTKFLESQQDTEADQSVVGVRTLTQLEREYARRQEQQAKLAERIRVMKEANGKVIPFSRLQDKQAQRAKAAQQDQQEPPGAA
jgi:DNA-binding transcriptional MerR regulator